MKRHIPAIILALVVIAFAAAFYFGPRIVAALDGDNQVQQVMP